MVFPELMGLVNKDVTDEQARALAYARLSKFNSDFLIYSDGSAEEGVNNGGAGVVLTTGDLKASQIIATLMRRGSVLPAPMKKRSHCNVHCSRLDPRALCGHSSGSGYDCHGQTITLPSTDWLWY